MTLHPNSKDRNIRLTKLFLNQPVFSVFRLPMDHTMNSCIPLSFSQVPLMDPPVTKKKILLLLYNVVSFASATFFGVQSDVS